MSETARDPIAALLAAGRAGGEKVEQGRFRLDWRKALDKIKRFQLTDPHRYVLEVVQAAVSRGATSVDVFSDADDIILTFDGEPFSDTELSRLFDYLFSQDEAAVALKQLALGVNSALALEPKYVVVESGDGTRATRVTMSTHTDLEIELVSGEDAVCGTRVHVRDRTSWRTLMDALRTPAEVRVLASECAFAPIPITHAGADLRAGFQVDAICRAPFDIDGVRGEVALRASGPAEAEVHLCMRGVRVVTFRHGQHWDEPDAVAAAWAPLRLAGVVAWVDNEKLSRNASHSDLQRDDELVRTLRAVESATRDVLLAYITSAMAGQGDELAVATERGYVRLALVMLLRRLRKGRLPRALDALLDLPDTVALAVDEPKTSSLRPVWDACRKGRMCTAGQRRFAAALTDLPDGMVPLLAPEIGELGLVFESGFRNVDEILLEAELGQQARRRRQADRQEAVLPDGACLVQTSVSNSKLSLRGELGLVDPNTAPPLPSSIGQEPSPVPKASVRVLCLRNGVPLGLVHVQAKVSWGFAVVESPLFEPTTDWTGVEKNKIVSKLGAIFDVAASGLLQKLAEDFPALPPAPSTTETGGYAPENGDEPELPANVLGLWPTDELSTLVRGHIDLLMRRLPTRSRKTAPWLWRWPLFRDLEGAPVSLARIDDAGESARIVIDMPWGPGAPKEVLVVNTSVQQARVIRRYLGKGVPGGKAMIKRRRTALSRDAARLVTRRENLAAAEAHRGAPVLDRSHYLAVVDLEIPYVTGQVGLPRATLGDSFIRYYVDGLPLRPMAIKAPVVVHAAISAPVIEADHVFSGVDPSCPVKPLERAVRDRIPALMVALASAPGGAEANAERIWDYLASLNKGKRDKAARERVVDALADVALVPTVDRGRITFDDLRADAAQNAGRFLYTRGEPFRQLIERPIVVCAKARATLLGRLLELRAKDHTRQLDAELVVLGKLDRPRKKPVLLAATALQVDISTSDITGVLALPLAISSTSGETHSVEILRGGVPIMNDPVFRYGLPLMGIVDCPALTPTSTWDDVAKDAVWKRVRDAIYSAVDRLVLEACRVVTHEPRGGLRDQALVSALVPMARQVFHGRARLFLDSATEIEAALARTPLWDSAMIGGERLTLEQLCEHRQEQGVVWFVRGKRGHVRADRIIVDAASDESHEALAGIFGKGLRDGERVLRKDEEAYLRRQAAPHVSVSLPHGLVLGAVSFDSITDAPLRFEGQVGIARGVGTGPAGLQIRFAVEGRLLFENTYDHAVPGLAHVDALELTPNRNWSGAKDGAQVKRIVAAASDALWLSVDQLARSQPVAEGVAMGGRQDLGRVFVLALTGLYGEDATGERDELRDLLAAIPLLHTLERRAVTPASLIEMFGEGKAVSVVSDHLGVGVPSGGRFVLRCSADELALVESLPLGGVKRCDDEWAEELAGQRRRRETPQVPPNLEMPVVAEVYFQHGPTSGVAGLLPIAPRTAYDDDTDPPSRVRLHLDRRKVAERAPQWSPAVEVWINDDRLQPTTSFRDVESGELLDEVLAVAQAQIPELLARACDGLRAEPRGALRQRLCAYVCARLEALQRASRESPRSAAARLLRAPIWPSCTSKGPADLSTMAIAAAYDAGKLGLVDVSVGTSEGLGDMVLIRARAADRSALARAFEGLADHTAALQQGQAHAAFLARRRVGRVDLGARRTANQHLWRRALEGAGWKGELGVRGSATNVIDVYLLSEERPLCGMATVGPCAADVVAQLDQLVPDASYTDVVRDEAYTELVEGVRSQVAQALAEMAVSLDQVPRRLRDAARNVLLRSLSMAGHSALPPPAAATISAAPLLTDVDGKAWSIDALRVAIEGEARAEIAAVDPEVVSRGKALSDRVVLVVRDDMWPALSQLVPLARYEEGYQRDMVARRRMERAPRRYRISRRRSLARADITDRGVVGELALSVPPERGVVALFSRGHLVEERAVPELLGLVGHLDGPWTANRAFTAVALEAEHRELLGELHRERLHAAVELAISYRRSKSSRRWLALCDYVFACLAFELRRVPRRLAHRRDMIITHDPSLPRSLRRALEAKVFQTGDGEWLDLATLVSGGKPKIVIAAERTKQRPDDGARIVVGDHDRLRPVFESVVGSHNVTSFERWKAKRKKSSTKRKKKDKPDTPEALDGRALSAVKSLLRDALGRKKRVGELRRAAIRRIKLVHLGSAALTAWDDRDIQLNADHPAWKSGRSAPLGDRCSPALHLAAAILGDLARSEPGPLDPAELHALLLRLAEHASPA